MKWNEREYCGLVKGKTRIKKGFLLFPKNINGEIRWLEFAKWEQKVIEFMCENNVVLGWDNDDWID